MRHVIEESLKDPIMLLLAAMGVTLHPHEWVGGMLLGLLGAAIAMKMQPERDTRELWLVVASAALSAHVAAMLAGRFLPDWQPQLLMLAAGFFSGVLVRMALRMSARIESKTDELADRLAERILPDRTIPPRDKDE